MAGPRRPTPETHIPLLTAREIFDLVRDDLARVEQEISTQNAEAIPAVAEVGSYVIQGGGKRLRPALLLLSAGMCGYRGTSTIRLGAVMEMIHTATLIHDDVIDDTNLRRGRPSANSRWGNHRSVLAGDWLYMQSFQLAMRERNFRILDVLIELTQNMVEGELLQLDLIGKLDVTDRQAMELSYRKTACLFSGCAQLGAVLAAQDPETEQAMADYGRFAGLAFQLVDDLLDFTSDPEKIGKPVLNDLKEGKVTLPLISTRSKAPGRRNAPSWPRSFPIVALRTRAPSRSWSSSAAPAPSSAPVRSRRITPPSPKPACLVFPTTNIAARCSPSPISYSTAKADASNG
jgi:octaprenyl-diphosphate synthase